MKKTDENIIVSEEENSKSSKIKTLCIILATIAAFITIVKIILKIVEKKKNKSELKEYIAFFSTKVYELTETISSGIMLSEYFSVLTTDFTNCDFNDNSFISVKSICGTLTVYMPENVNVKFDYINNFSIIKSDFDDVGFNDELPTVFVALKGFASVVKIKKKAEESES